MVMDSIQSKLGYDFTRHEYLSSAFVAAHRSEKDGVADDGNRGMARIGQIAIEMAETTYAVVVEKASLTDINRRSYWWKDKKRVATACKVLGIAPCIIQSVRQTGQELSLEVLNFAMNAVIGAVWLDCEDQNRSINDSCKTISRILGQIDIILSSSMAAGGDQNDVTLDGNSGRDLNTREDSANVETYEDLSVFPPPSSSGEHEEVRELGELGELEELEDLITEQSSTQQFFLDLQQSSEYDATGSFSQNYDHGCISSSLLAESQDMGAQAVFSIEREAVMEPITLGAADSSMSITTTATRALSGQESGESVIAQHPDSAQRKRKRTQTERDKVNAALESLRSAEQKKASAYSQPERTQLLIFLEYPQTALPKDSCHLLRFLYMAIGSWDTLADFTSQLQSVREARRSPKSPPLFSSTTLMAFIMMLQLDNERTTCILLKRYYAIKLLEDGQQSSQPYESMQVETPESFEFGNSQQRGNPQVRREAAEIKFLTSKIVTHAENTSQKYSTVYDKVKRFRQLGKRLQILTKAFGIGILVLLPSGPSFSDFSLTDRMLLDIRPNDLTEFTTLLENHQGQLLRTLSNAVAPNLLALAAFYQGQDMDPPPGLVDVESLKNIPKALLTL